MLNVLIVFLAVMAFLTLLTMHEGLVERMFIFFPTSRLDYLPSQYGLNCQEIFFTTPTGLRLHAWYAEAAPKAPVILYCHGNGGNISHRLGIMAAFRKVGLGVFLFDYRGYGLSQGVPSENGVYEDAWAAYRYLVTEIGLSPQQIAIAGHSLGGVIAVDLASREPCRALILESTFTNVGDMGRYYFAWLPTRRLWRDKFNAVRRIQPLKVPKLLVHGECDRIVPCYLGKKLFDLAPEPKIFYQLAGAGHNNLDVVGGDAYFLFLKRFIETAPEKRVAK
ncbi:alpha/beta hydrolase [Desulfobacca acetoxidans]|uniref:Alpha/beta hydrolase fold protein n=1 Tax=Desulfobacca acetoxidans (strain ATCC 700848 / DSM 11109 / ASRB2) TaxID=880072 RepID=F2NIH7_DESAR|nr:alpha/beta hydrolase [Desulfobacca acetoxidans]AEB10379.1 alpha/beta hydrolase fold protein [Desulfobacca acetoxidans DSM 11109]